MYGPRSPEFAAKVKAGLAKSRAEGKGRKPGTFKHSAASIEKMKASQRLRVVEGRIRKPGEYNHSAEARANMSAAKKGRPFPQAAIEAARIANAGDGNIMRRSRDAVERSAANRRGAKRTNATVSNIRNACRSSINAKLNVESVASIKMRLMLGERVSELASEFEVSQATISYIKSGDHWADVMPFDLSDFILPMGG